MRPLFIVWGICLVLSLENARAAIEDSTAVRPPESVESVSRDSVPDAFVWRRIEQKAFGVGEKLVFDIAYGPIVAGTATMSIPDTQRIEGRACFHVLTTARSTNFFDSFFKVRDKVEVFIDMEGIFPWKFEKTIREGGYKSHRLVRYDPINQRIFYKKDTLEVAPYIQDVLSSFYYVRILPLRVGEHFDIDNFGDGRIYPLRILVHKKEKIDVPAGTFDCVLVEPILKAEGIFKHEGRLRIWLTDDERRMPVLMKSKALIGSIDARLREYRFHDSK